MPDENEAVKERLKTYIGLLRETGAHGLGAQGLRPDARMKDLLCHVADLEREAGEELLALDAASKPDVPLPR